MKKMMNGYTGPVDPDPEPEQYLLKPCFTLMVWKKNPKWEEWKKRQKVKK